MTLQRCFLTSVLLAINLACVNKAQVVQTPPPPSTARDTAPVRWITLSDLERSLPPAPISVVFDVDDTALFTSAGFQWGTRTYGAHIVSAGVTVREGDLPSEEDRRKYREFWTRMNNEHDEYSVKKWIAGELIALHKRRGDQIHFVTKRIFTGSERLTAMLSETFSLPGLGLVIFTSRQAKTEAFRRIKAVLEHFQHCRRAEADWKVGLRPRLAAPRRLHSNREIALSYGDSDGDIRKSIAAGARTSVNADPVHDGAFGEEVLVNSEF